MEKKRSFFSWRFVRKERRRGNKQAALFLLIAIPSVFLFTRYVVSAGVVTDISMFPTLPEGGYYFINKYIYRFTPPQRGDIVVLHPHKETQWHYVKRVVGLAGETLQILSGLVYVNGRLLEEPYAFGKTQPDLGPIQIPKKSCYVMGDNRENSEDSREFGYVPLDNIEGKIHPGKLFSPQ